MSGMQAGTGSMPEPAYLCALIAEGRPCAAFFVVSLHCMASATFQMSSLEGWAECHVDVSVSDAEVINDCICWGRDGHSRLPILVARISASGTCFK